MPVTRILFCLLLLCCTTTVIAQDNKEKVKDLVTNAIKLEDEGKPDEALPMLLQAQKLDPSSSTPPYEIAYYYYDFEKDYNLALISMKKAMTYPDINDRYYELMGNIYDMKGDSIMALKTYSDGIKKFPTSGRLFLEMGIYYGLKKNYDQSLVYYEKGIEVAPMFPSDYYRAAGLFFMSDASVWGMIYGELFMNLEVNTERTSNMSKILYYNYKSQIVIHSKDSMEVNFCKNTNIEVDENSMKKGEDIRLPFSAIYETTLLLSLISTEAINTESLCKVRKIFLDQYYDQGLNKKYPNVLFEYQRTIDKAGFFDAYNHWILRDADQNAFTKWQSGHTSEWEGFKKWYKDNPIKITDENKFLRLKA